MLVVGKSWSKAYGLSRIRARLSRNTCRQSLSPFRDCRCAVLVFVQGRGDRLGPMADHQVDVGFGKVRNWPAAPGAARQLAVEHQFAAHQAGSVRASFFKVLRSGHKWWRNLTSSLGNPWIACWGLSPLERCSDPPRGCTLIPSWVGFVRRVHIATSHRDVAA